MTGIEILAVLFLSKNNLPFNRSPIYVDIENRKKHPDPNRQILIRTIRLLDNVSHHSIGGRNNRPRIPRNLPLWIPEKVEGENDQPDKKRSDPREK